MSEEESERGSKRIVDEGKKNLKLNLILLINISYCHYKWCIVKIARKLGSSLYCEMWRYCLGSGIPRDKLIFSRATRKREYK